MIFKSLQNNKCKNQNNEINNFSMDFHIFRMNEIKITLIVNSVFWLLQGQGNEALNLSLIIVCILPYFLKF